MTVPRAPGSGGPTIARRMAVGVALAATVVLAATAALIWDRTGFRVTGGYVPLAVPITLSAALAYAGTGSITLLRRSETRIGWVWWPWACSSRPSTSASRSPPDRGRPSACRSGCRG